MELDKKPEEQKSRRRRVKKVKGHGGHHGGAWKVAYADLVTALMALFLVLWLISQADTKLKEEIANYFRSPGVFSSTKGGILKGKKKVSREPEKLTAMEEEQKLTTIADSLQKSFESHPAVRDFDNRVKVSVVDEGLKIDILDKAREVSFEVGSAELNERAKDILKEIAKSICELPNKIKIGGHTDKRGFPSENGYSNWELSADRANAARRELLKECVSPDQISKITGYANTDPIVPRDPYAHANRRISITVLRVHKLDSSKDDDDDDKENASKIESRFVEDPTDENESESESVKPKTRKTRIAAKQKSKKKSSENDESTEDKDSEAKTKEDKKEKPKSKNSERKPKPKDKKIQVGKPDVVPKRPITKEQDAIKK